jgi:hypothetical protein
MIMVAGHDPSTMIDVLQPYLDRTVEWGARNGLKFSAQKTMAIMFTRKEWNTEAQLRMNGVTIKFSEQVLSTLGLP